MQIDLIFLLLLVCIVVAVVVLYVKVAVLLRLQKDTRLETVAVHAFAVKAKDEQENINKNIFGRLGALERMIEAEEEKKPQPVKPMVTKGEKDRDIKSSLISVLKKNPDGFSTSGLSKASGHARDTVLRHVELMAADGVLEVKKEKQLRIIKLKQGDENNENNKK